VGSPGFGDPPVLTHYSHFQQYHTHEPPLVCRGALHLDGLSSPVDGATIYSSPPYTPLPPNMNTKSTSPSSISTQGAPKRRRKTQSDEAARPTIDSPPGSATATSASGGGVGPGTPGGGPGGTSSAFRNVSACNRCRLRKNRCDQRLPACLSCEKAVCTLFFRLIFLFFFFLLLRASRRDRHMSDTRLYCVYYCQC
jgi:hypothetical protein